MAEELKACPFCGDQPTVFPPGHLSQEGWAIECCQALAHQPTQEQAVEAWNTRAPDSTVSAQAAEIERLREAVDQSAKAVAIAALWTADSQITCKQIADTLEPVRAALQGENSHEQ